MKKFLLLIPVISLTACSSGEDYGRSIKKEQAQEIYTQIYEKSQKPVDFELEYVVQTDETTKSTKTREISESKYIYKKNTSGHFYFETSHSANGEKLYTNRFIYSNVDGLDVSYIEMEGSNSVKRVAAYGNSIDINDYAFIETESRFIVYLQLGSDIDSVAVIPPPKRDDYFITVNYYTRSEGNLSIVMEMRNKPDTKTKQIATSSKYHVKGEALFDGYRTKRIGYTLVKDDEYVKEIETNTITVQYSEDLSISIPSDWREYLVN